MLANQLSHKLISLGASQNQSIGVIAKNSQHLIISLLAILKSGAVYTPIDPSYPIERVKYIIDDTKPRLLLIEEEFIGLTASFTGDVILMNDNSYKDLLAFPIENASLEYPFDSLAYIIYTSGSTGSPKGIKVSHRNTGNIAVGHISYYPLKTVALLTGPIGFDVSILTIFHCLANQGMLCLPESGFNAETYCHEIRKYHVNYIISVPGIYSILLDQGLVLDDLKVVSLTGENIPDSLVEKHSKFTPNAILYNEYGPSEIAIGTTIAKIYDPEKKKSQKITAGFPLPNTQIDILDESLHPVSKGNIGEIIAKGDGLTLGYLNHPEETNKRFVEVNHNGIAERVYRTGDLGSLDEDGSLILHGRIDNQVKIRGVRIELDEIQRVILKLNFIKNTAVIPVTNESEEKKIVAFYTTDLLNDANPQDIRAFLKDYLLPQMIPTEFYRIPKMPLTPNNKIDRNALIELASNLKSNSLESGSSTKQILREIWIHTLMTDRLNDKDNFFDLGGDSLLLAKLQTAIETKFQIVIPIVDLLKNVNIEDQTRYIESRKETNSFKK